ncbi:hydrogenase 4 subunit B, partial [Escherichia coli]
IILLAVGVAMVGLSLHDPLLTVVGLLGALFHLLNHALFKGLLFLGAGAIISRLHTHDMEKMGALAKRMPWTAAACLIGCLAISAIPPLNGFISEWYTWQSLFSLSRVEAVALQLAGPIAMVMLAVTGGLAVMCFVKMYGITFCGAPRSTHAEEAQEVPNTMIVAMLLLAALCVLIALSASWLAPKIMHIAHAFTNTPPVTVASGIALVPGTFHTQVTPSLLLLLLLAMPLLPGLYWLWCRSRRAAFR